MAIWNRQYARDVTAQDILELIQTRQRESNDLEFKESAAADLLKAACGIANAGGGYIIIGIAEDAQHCASRLVDITNTGREEDSIRQRLRDGLAPRPIIEVAGLAVAHDGIIDNIIIIRVSPQNPPHMVSQDKRTEFYGRYDATTERMRYEEIEQRFREKHESGELDFTETTRVVIETIRGRTSLSRGAKGAFDSYEAQVQNLQEPIFALIGVSDGNAGSVTESNARAILAEPLYSRQGGWVIAHRSLDVRSESGLWIQRYGESSITTINPSGDLTFLKAVDEILCWRQETARFNESPRLYPNALVEYCLSFAYAMADIATRTVPQHIFLKPILSKMRDVNLPLGEGGSVWFDSPIQPPKKLDSDFAEGLIVPIDTTNNKPIFVRNMAFLLAAQVYALFGYAENQVAFAADDEIAQESDPDVATLTSIRGYLQNILHLPLHIIESDFDRRVYWLGTHGLGQSYRIGISKEFLEDHHSTEATLFAKLNAYDIRALVEQHAPDAFLILTNDGLKPFPRSSPPR